MVRNNKTKTSFKLPPAILDFIAFAVLGLLVASAGFASPGSMFTGSFELALYPIVFISAVMGFGFYIFTEYKYGRLKLKNVLLYLGAVIALMNILAVALLPNQITILEKSITITPFKRVEYLLCGLPFGLLPFAYFYLFPRKILNRHHLNIVLMLMLGFVLVTIIASLFLDWNHLINGEAIKSFLGFKNGFALVLALGIFLTILLRIQTKKWWWILFLIPTYIFLILTEGKISLIAATLAIVIYFIIRLVQICKKSKDNLIITLSIISFVVLLSPLFIVGVIRAESGILASVRTYFTDALESAKNTINSRMYIWRSTLDLLGSYRVIFGYGLCSFGPILNLLYIQVKPYSWDEGIASSHNAVLEILGRGGIILLLIEIALYVYLIRVTIKMLKKNRWLSIWTLIFIGLGLLIGTFESTFIGSSTEIFFNLVIVTPIMAEYYIFLDKDEQTIRKDIVDNVKVIKNKQYKSKLLTLNKKRLLYEAQYIAYDLNSKIRL